MTRKRRFSPRAPSAAAPDVVAPDAVMEAHARHALAVSFSTDGRLLLSGGMDATLNVWSTKDWRRVSQRTAHTRSVNAIALAHADAKVATGGSDGRLIIWHSTGADLDPAPVRVIHAHKRPISSVAFAPDGKTLASASYDSTVKLWSLDEGAPHTELSGHPRNVSAVVFLPGGYVASAGIGASVWLWNAKDGQLVYRLGLDSHAILALAVSPDRRLLAATTAEGQLALWNLGTSSACPAGPPRLVDLGMRGTLPAMFAPNSAEVLVGHDGGISLVCSGSGAIIGQTSIGVKGIYAVAFSPDARRVACAAADGCVRVWLTDRLCVQRPGAYGH